MLGLGNTLSGGIVPAAASSFGDSYSLSFDCVNDYVDLADAASTISGVVKKRAKGGFVVVALIAVVAIVGVVVEIVVTIIAIIIILIIK